jgi:hypothetical protein
MLGKQRHETLSPVAMSPTILQWEVDPGVIDYQKKQTKKAGFSSKKIPALLHRKQSETHSLSIITGMRP